VRNGRSLPGAGLERRGHRATILRGGEENGGRGLDPLAELNPVRRRILLTILIVDLADFDDTEFQFGRRKLDECVRHLAIDRSLPKTADKYRHVSILYRESSSF
jgi:hypothetical protein